MREYDDWPEGLRESIELHRQYLFGPHAKNPVMGLIPSAILSQVEKALEEGDADFFQNVADALRASQVKGPIPAEREAVFWARCRWMNFKTEEYYLGDKMEIVEPTKAEIRAFIERMWKRDGRSEGTVVKWNRVWKAAGLQFLKAGKPGPKPNSGTSEKTLS